MPEKATASSLKVADCGLVRYRQLLQRQLQLRDKRRSNEIGNTVLLAEHYPVITLGARQSANKLLVRPDELAQRHIDLVPIRRGGGATAHNPGQLLCYPILDLRQLRLGISEYVRHLEAFAAELLDCFGVSAQRKKGFPGLWVGARKIASVGVRVSRFVTYHGIALNIDNDLGIFDLIIPCGLEAVAMTSVLRETGRRPPMAKVKDTAAGLVRTYFSSKGTFDYANCS